MFQFEKYLKRFLGCKIFCDKRRNERFKKFSREDLPAVKQDNYSPSYQTSDTLRVSNTREIASAIRVENCVKLLWKFQQFASTVSKGGFEEVTAYGVKQTYEV